MERWSPKRGYVKWRNYKITAPAGLARVIVPPVIFVFHKVLLTF